VGSPAAEAYRRVAAADAPLVAAAAFNEDRTDGSVCWIRYVTVRHDRRGEGVGPRLLAFVAARAGERDYDRGRIAVNNPFAYQALYRAGFRFTGEETGMAELVLDRPLTDADEGGAAPATRSTEIYLPRRETRGRPARRRRPAGVTGSRRAVRERRYPPSERRRLYPPSGRRSDMDVEAFFEEMPFADLLGIELTTVADGHAEGRLPMRADLSWHSERVLAHGGVTYTLADTVGGAALVSLVARPVPTVDMRIDYLEAGTGDLRAEADVVRRGGDVGVVEVDVYATDDDTHLASARGVYKTADSD
jgi:uncharacterized protein (TIGR00369 family)